MMAVPPDIAKDGGQAQISGSSIDGKNKGLAGRSRRALA
jgi:hypothetical protein